MGLLIVLAVWGWTRAGRTQSVKLAGGGRIEILKVSAGTNHFFADERGWKAFAAETLPAKALAKLGIKRKEVNRPHGSLALWVREIDEQGRVIPVSVRSAGTVFSDGRYVVGSLQSWSSNVVMIELLNYSRVESEVEVRMLTSSEKLSMKVKNPAPRKRAEWVGEALAQTNVVGNTVFSVYERSASLLRFQAKATNGPGLGWMYWRYEMEDAVGNWEQGHLSSHGWELDRSRFERGPLKLTVFPEEYLSAGYVSEPTSGAVVKLEVNPRAAALGVKDMFVLGFGGFKARTVRDVSVIEPAKHGLQGIGVIAWRPNVVVACRSTCGVERIDARVHERSDRGDGLRIFRLSALRAEERSMPDGNVLRIFPIGWEPTTNQTEVEVVVRHRAVVFYVDMEKAGPKTRL